MSFCAASFHLPVGKEGSPGKKRRVITINWHSVSNLKATLLFVG
jgi:hypothetical protein